MRDAQIECTPERSMLNGLQHAKCVQIADHVVQMDGLVWCTCNISIRHISWSGMHRTSGEPDTVACIAHMDFVYDLTCHETVHLCEVDTFSCSSAKPSSNI